MARVDKAYQQRQEGMLYALKIAKEKGIEALEKEIRSRGILKLDISVPYSEIEAAWDSIACNLMATVTSTVLWTLHEWAGFGKKRLREFKEQYDHYSENLLDLNWHGESYVTFEDRAKILNEKYGFQFDLEHLERISDYGKICNKMYRKMDLVETCDFLERNGHTAAAECLRKKVEWLRDKSA